MSKRARRITTKEDKTAGKASAANTKDNKRK
jgi:hypothetical protein